MALQITQYVDPGVYIGEVIVPSGINISTPAFVVGLIGPGSRVKRTTNEAIQRGLVEGETLTLAASSPHSDALAFRGDRSLQNTTVYRDGKALSDSFVSYDAPYIETVAAGAGIDLTVGATLTTPAFCLELDGNTPVTIIFTIGAGATTVQGTTITVGESTISALATADATEIAAAINEALNPTDGTANAAVTLLGYGAAYGSAATAPTGATGLVRITSPLTSPVADVRSFAAFDENVHATLFGAASKDAAVVLTVSDLVYNALSTYTIDYIDRDDTDDDLQNTGVTDVIRVGSFAGVATFAQATDFDVSGDTLDWSILSAAEFTGTETASPANNLVTAVNDTIALSIDGRPTIEIDLVANPSPPFGYDATSPITAGSAAAVAQNINATLSESADYGPRYGAVASVSSGAIKLTGVALGETAGSIVISEPSAADATVDVFGTFALPRTSVGTGKKPAQASIYFASYETTRPSADYNLQKRFFSLDQARSDLGTENAQNPLMLATLIAFKNGAQSVVVSQVDDDTLPGSPTRAELLEALEATENNDTVTDVIMLSTDLASQIDLKNHIEVQGSPTEKHYRRGWFGMPRSTSPGDKDTADTFVYRATRTLQVTPESPARGRLLLLAPPQLTGVSIDVLNGDSVRERIELDTSYLAVAAAAKRTSFSSPALSLSRQTLAGFNTDDITTPWNRAQRATMASQGVMVVTYDAGNFKILDPVTTEVGGGGLAAFSYPSTTSQKDVITRKVDRAIDANLVGIVPLDLADFIIDIKLVIESVLNAEIASGTIGPFRNDDGSPRVIDLTQDIDVEQDPNDPTKFFFSYFYNLRYPALRFFGQFSVDSPFFVGG